MVLFSGRGQCLKRRRLESLYMICLSFPFHSCVFPLTPKELQKAATSEPGTQVSSCYWQVYPLSFLLHRKELWALFSIKLLWHDWESLSDQLNLGHVMLIVTKWCEHPVLPSGFFCVNYRNDCVTSCDIASNFSFSTCPNISCETPLILTCL